MQWYEYLIIVGAIGIVILPIVLAIINKKRGKVSCGCSCSACASKHNCPHCNIINKE